MLINTVKVLKKKSKGKIKVNLGKCLPLWGRQGHWKNERRKNVAAMVLETFKF